jgi:predicted phage terminase large subunit-like protein
MAETFLLDNPDNLSAKQLDEWLEITKELSRQDSIDEARAKFLPFVRRLWPSTINEQGEIVSQFIAGSHHGIFADALDRIASGDLKRLIVNMPPRHTKSEFASFLFPAFFMGKFPGKKIIQATHTAPLAMDFGKKARNLIETEEYAELFPHTQLAKDAKAGGRWRTTAQGEYFAVGVEGKLAGRGADLLIIDDPHSEQDAYSPDVLASHYNWYQQGPIQRLQPNGAIIIVMTRWHDMDITGQVLKQQSEEYADQWEVIKFPAAFENMTRPLWPEFWTMDALRAKKAGMTISQWNAQYMQDPTSEEGALIKREWWKDWPYDQVPKLSYILQSYDTAYLKTETADYSAITTWGVFRPSEDEGDCLLLLDSKKGKWEFPELKRIAQEEYEYWKPDQVLIENKATGAPLAQELRRGGVPIRMFSPSKGNDKTARVNSSSPMFESGMIYAPKRKQFAQEVIEECAGFPFAENDDLVDSTTQAVMRFRKGGFLTHPEDEVEPEDFYGSTRPKEYY